MFFFSLTASREPNIACESLCILSMNIAGKYGKSTRDFEHKQMRRNCYQQERIEDHNIQSRVRQGTALR